MTWFTMDPKLEVADGLLADDDFDRRAASSPHRERRREREDR
jgi:hypothetical protein